MNLNIEVRAPWVLGIYGCFVLSRQKRNLMFWFFSAVRKHELQTVSRGIREPLVFMLRGRNWGTPFVPMRTAVLCSRNGATIERPKAWNASCKIHSLVPNTSKGVHKWGKLLSYVVLQQTDFFFKSGWCFGSLSYKNLYRCTAGVVQEPKPSKVVFGYALDTDSWPGLSWAYIGIMNYYTPR